MNNQANENTPTKILGKMRMWILMKKTKSQRRERKLTCQDGRKNQQALLNIVLAMMMLMRMFLCIFEFQLVLLITFLFCATKATPVVATHTHSHKSHKCWDASNDFNCSSSCKQREQKHGFATHSWFCKESCPKLPNEDNVERAYVQVRIF